MSLVGLLTATEKQVHLGRLHMIPIQWHLKNNWRVPESLEKVIPVPKSLHPHLRWWLEESNVLQGQPLHPLNHALQLLYRRIKRRLGRSLTRAHCKGNLVPSRKPVAYQLSGTKGGIFGPKRVPKPLPEQCSSNSHGQHYSDFLHKQGGGMRSGPLCAHLWRVLTWCTRKQVTLKARHIPGHLNVVADKLSRLGQIIQSGPSFQRYSRQYATGGTHQKSTFLPQDSTTN